MPMQPRVVEVKGLQALHERLRSGDLWGRSVRKHLIEGASKAAHKTARRAAKGRAGRGNLGRAIQFAFGFGAPKLAEFPDRFRLADIAGLKPHTLGPLEELAVSRLL